MLLSRRMSSAKIRLVNGETVSFADFAGALSKVQKPARYAGGERGALVKNWDSAVLKTCVCFPDLYELGMNYLGSAILHHIINSRREWLAERCFAPADDMYRVLKESGMPLWSLESRRPLYAFDALLFSFTYELSYPMFLRMLDAGGVPLLARDRTGEDPIILAGGGSTANPEPVAEFVDAFGIGDAEILLEPMLESLAETAGSPRANRLCKLARIPGVYVPMYYEPRYASGKFEGISVSAKVPAGYSIPDVIQRAYAADLNDCPIPPAFPAPVMADSRDRVAVEIMRGCPQGCRFCQAGFTYRPARPRDVPGVIEAAKWLVALSGYGDATLLSLSSLDHPQIAGLIEKLRSELGDLGVTVSLPSMRMDAMSREIAANLRGPRETSLTFAIEAGSQRLRDAINKQVGEDDIMETLDAALAAGWHKFKLYFMCGFKGETMDDVEETAYLVRRMARFAASRSKRPAKFHVSQSVLVPKPVTPFQWQAMERPGVTMNKQSLLRRKLAEIKNVRFNWHDPGASALEALLARGDRRMAAVLLRIHESDALPPTLVQGGVIHTPWQDACEAEGIDANAALYEEWDHDAPLPWGHVNHYLRPEFLRSEAEKFERARTTPGCFEKCVHCGLPCEPVK